MTTWLEYQTHWINSPDSLKNNNNMPQSFLGATHFLKITFISLSLAWLLLTIWSYNQCQFIHKLYRGKPEDFLLSFHTTGSISQSQVPDAQKNIRKALLYLSKPKIHLVECPVYDSGQSDASGQFTSRDEGSALRDPIWYTDLAICHHKSSDGFAKAVALLCAMKPAGNKESFGQRITMGPEPKGHWTGWHWPFICPLEKKRGSKCVFVRDGKSTL